MNERLTAEREAAARHLPPGWSVDALRCASTSLAHEHRSEDWVR
jgi:hypothetical protein